MKNVLPFTVLFAALLGASSPALSEDPSLNRDRPLIFPTIASKMDLLEMKHWLQDAGIGFVDDSFVYNLLHLGMGISYPVSRNLNITVSGGETFRFGMSFK